MSVRLDDEAGSAPLDVFQLVDVSCLVGVPDYNTVLQGAADEGHESRFLTVAGSEPNVSAQEAHGGAGLPRVVDGGRPLKVVSDRHPQVRL